MATAWAVMEFVGLNGYVDLVKTTLANADEMRAGIAEIDGNCRCWATVVVI